MNRSVIVWTPLSTSTPLAVKAILETETKLRAWSVCPCPSTLVLLHESTAWAMAGTTRREVEIMRAEAMACSVLLLQRVCLVVAVNMMRLAAL